MLGLFRRWVSPGLFINLVRSYPPKFTSASKALYNYRKLYLGANIKTQLIPTAPTREAERQICGPHYFIVLEKICERNLFPTAMLLFVDLSPASAGGIFSWGRLGGRWGSAVGSLAGGHQALGLLQRPCQSCAAGRGPWQPAGLKGARWEMSHYQGSAPHQERGWWQPPSGSAALSFPPGASSSALGSSPQRV